MGRALATLHSSSLCAFSIFLDTPTSLLCLLLQILEARQYFSCSKPRARGQRTDPGSAAGRGQISLRKKYFLRARETAERARGQAGRLQAPGS